MHHKDKYEVLTFKRDFNTASMNPDLFWVELKLIENPDIIINFDWNAKNNALYISSHNRQDLSIESLTRYQQQEIVLRKEIHETLDNDVLDMEVNVFNHTISITLEKEPTQKDFETFSRKIDYVLQDYPDTWTQEAHVDFKLKDEKKGFYELIVKPNTYNDSKLTFRYYPNAIVANNSGSKKAEHIDHVIQQEFSKPESPIYLKHIWVNQSKLNSFYIAFENHEPLKRPEKNKHLTEAVGVYMVEMNYPNLDMKTLTYYDYKTTPRDGIFLYLIDQLPEDYQYLIEHP
ncbi:hypothetical protein ACFFU1_00405 [Algibacter miyuki]|uniref:Uncharacterized protein n=1 Tax=Algibacter miyuki TaxID=1306933 RepID=A0ABV5GUM9_9FLAO|nr:hypothetical protein [Algibacter miyuki]MDN3664670.1 hypothetical protein [Algibacter miyuki]